MSVPPSLTSVTKSAAAAAPAADAAFAGRRLDPGDRVRVDFDAHGIPHIQAQTVEDAFFGQGYVAATMRLWQLDLQSRRLRGRLAEAFGPDFVPYDHAARLVLSRIPPRQDWDALGPRLEGIATAFVAGINRRLAEVHADPSLLPPEFGLFDLRPLPWEVDDLVRVRFCASPNVKSEFRRALLHQQDALALDALAQKLEPARVCQVPQGLDVHVLREGQLDLFDKLTAPLPWPKAWRPEQRAAVEALPDVDAADQGSNAWVIAGRLTQSGRPIIANDPHLAFSIPGPRMVTHLMAPGFNVTGAGPVWRPGVQFGHNEHIAFGRTDFQIDQEDLYVLELDEAGQAWRSPEGWVPLERRRETIAVRGASPVTVELTYAGMGPVFFEDRAARHALALRAVWLEPATCVALEYVPKLFATDWKTFRQALRSAVWGTNYMYVDAQGNIGWQSAGRVPVREQHDGLMPVPAARGYGWSGVLPLDDMPHEFNPERGWIGTANQQPQAPNWPGNGRVISFEWKPDDRYRRVVQFLEGVARGTGGRATVEQSWAFQQDVLSLRAVELCGLLRAALPDPLADGLTLSTLARQAAAVLAAWDGQLLADSAPALLYAAWWQQLQQAARSALVPAAARSLIPTLHPHAVTDWLRMQWAQPLRPGSAGTALLDKTLADAQFKAQALQAQRRRALTWGDVHQVDLQHPLARWLGTTWQDRVNAQGGASGGDASTVNARWYASFDRPAVTGGASFRAVLEAGRWDTAMAINLPGQSGDPRSPWYRNLYPRWVSGASMPLPFTNGEVARASVQQLHINPVPGRAVP